MSVADDLVIFWSSHTGQDEVRGLYLYGLMQSDAVSHDLESMKAAWKPTSVQCRESSLESELGRVLLVTVKFDGILDAQLWETNLDLALSSLLGFGAIVAWAGGEDCSWSPDVLNPESGVGNVLAAKCDVTGFLCNAKFNEPMQFLDDTQLTALWSFVKLKTAATDDVTKEER